MNVAAAMNIVLGFENAGNRRMDDVQTVAQPVMRHSFSGRVRNYNLPPTAQNALMPVFEALTNSLYAIQERFPDDWPDEGVIRVEVLRAREADDDREHDPVTGFVISDNGLGLDDRLFGHFQELDTEYRAAKKGRGIGRLSWLKVFVKAEVVSIFNRDEALMERSFTFQLSNAHPFTDYRESPHSADQDTGTIVSLSDFREIFAAKAHDDPVEIQNAILAHFISLFAQPKRLRIDLVDEGRTTNLSDLFFGSIVRGEGPFEVDFAGHVGHMQHLLLPRKIAPIGNTLVYCAADRSVVSKSMNDVIGMKVLPDEEHEGLIYIGLVSGEIFDESLNHERTGFDFGDIDFEEVNGIAVDRVRIFLAPYLEEKRKKNRELLEGVLSDNPMYVSAIGNVEKYVESMPLNWDDTKLVQDIAVRRFRARRALSKQVGKLEANTASMSDDEFAGHVRKLSAELGDTEKGALAQYVVERRLVIDLLQARRRVDTESGKHQSEDVVHEIFCPLGVTTDILEYDDHNLWLLDDRLAYYSYVASDRPIKTVAKDVEPVTAEETERRDALGEIGAYTEEGEPDLAIFKAPMLFRRSQTLDPVVIVEFKSPSKTTYSGAPKDNPFLQIRKYIESLQSKTCYTYDGDRITDIGSKTSFHCFLIAEPSEQLYALLRSHAIHKPTPDGDGRFGYIDDLNAYFEFIPYDQVLRNAALRNEAFFKRLNLAK